MNFLILSILNRGGLTYFDFMFASMNEQMATGFFPPHVGDHCSYCSFRCPAVASQVKSAEFPLEISTKESK